MKENNLCYTDSTDFGEYLFVKKDFYIKLKNLEMTCFTYNHSKKLNVDKNFVRMQISEYLIINYFR